MASPVSITINADTGQFITSVDGASKAVQRIGRETQAAQNVIAQSFRKIIADAEAAGESEQQLANITRQAQDAQAAAVEAGNRRIEAAQQASLLRRQRAEEAAAATARATAAAMAASQATAVQKSPVDALSGRKAALAASYSEEKAALREAGASQAELAALTQRYSQMRAAAVEEAEAKITASLQAERRLPQMSDTLAGKSMRSGAEDEAAAAEQAAIRHQMEQTAVPAQPQGFWARLLGIGSGEADGVASEASRVAQSVEKVGEAGNGMTSKTRMASASLRALRGDFTNNIRAAEGFASTLPGLSSLFEKAFPYVGAAALGATIWEGVSALKAMYDQAQLVPKALRDGWEGVNAPIEEGVDGLRKANDELRIADDRLNHRSTGRSALALELDDIVLAADKAAASAIRADAEVRKLLKENTVGFTQSLFSGQTRTAPIEKDIQKQLDDIADAERDNKDLTRANPQDQKGIDARGAAIQSKYRNLYQESDNVLKTLGPANQDGKLDSVLTDYRGAKTYAGDMLDQQAAEKDNATQTLQNKRDQDARDKQRQAEEAQRKAQEAARKAAETQRQQWQKELDKQKLDNPSFNDADAMDFWKGKAQSKDVLPDNRIDVLTKQADAYKAFIAKNTAEVKQINEQAQRDQRAAWDLDHDSWAQAGHRTAQDEADYWSIRTLEADLGSQNYIEAYNKMTAAVEAAQKEAEQAQKARNKAAQEQAQESAAYATAALQIKQQAGQISRVDATTQTANIHAAQYQQQMYGQGGLQDSYNEAFKQDPNSAATVNAQAAITKAAADRDVQIMQDAANSAAASWQGASKTAMAQWVQDAQDTGKQISEVFKQSIDGINSDIANLAVGDKANFKQTFKGIGKSLVTDSLKQIEAPALKAFGVGKADGSSSNPYYVKLAGSLGVLRVASTGSVGVCSVVGRSMDGIRGLFGGAPTPKLPGMPEYGSGNAPDLSSVYGPSDSEPTQSSGASTAKAVGGIAGFFGKLAGMFGVGSTGSSKGSSDSSQMDDSGPPSDFGGGDALGGDVKAGVPIDVGEMGREKFVPKTDGMIIPNNKLGSDRPNVTVQVANGVTPEQMKMHTQEALATYHNTIARHASVSAVSEHSSRRPSHSR